MSLHNKDSILYLSHILKALGHLNEVTKTISKNSAGVINVKVIICYSFIANSSTDMAQYNVILHRYLQGVAVLVKGEAASSFRVTPVNMDAVSEVQLNTKQDSIVCTIL